MDQSLSRREDISDRVWFADAWAAANVPISAAVLWVASDGKIATRDFDFPLAAIQKAQEIVIDALRMAAIEAHGKKGAAPALYFEPIPPMEFNRDVAPVGQDTPLASILSEDPSLRWGALSGDALGDSIVTRRGDVVWREINVPQAAVKKLPTMKPDAATGEELIEAVQAFAKEKGRKPNQSDWKEINEIVGGRASRPKIRDAIKSVYPVEKLGRPEKDKAL